MASILWSQAQYFVERPLNLKAFCSRAGFRSRCFLSPFSRSSETSLHRKSLIIYHKRRINWVSFVICCKIVVSMQTRSVSKPFKNVCSERESHGLRRFRYLSSSVVSSCTGTQKKETLTNCVITPCMVMKTKGIPSCTGTPGQPLEFATFEFATCSLPHNRVRYLS